MSNNIHISASELKNCNNIELNGKTADFSHTDFWYYTSMDTADKILSGQCFYTSNLKLMNDLNESKLHESEKERIHALCFVNSQSEKIPMWYLYSGITGEGISLGFTPSTMMDLIRSVIKVTPVGADNVTLTIGKDIEMQCGWVYYRKKQPS